VRIATRGSALALAQARHVAELLGGEAEIVEVLTSGDRRRAVDDKREWVLEIEEALERGQADLAVHSAKDVPATLPPGFVVAGVPERAAPFDALCGAESLAGLSEGARVGTSSLRRAAALRAMRPDLDVVELRGNVDTRLRKLADGECDAAVLALAGLQRLGREDAAGAVLEELVPAAGQGALLLEARADHAEARAAAEAITDVSAQRCLAAERSLVLALGADCNTPVGAHATVVDEARLRLRVFVGKVDGSAWLRDELDGGDPATLGAEVAERLLSAGAGELLRG
jgi:hydroxymethylbilane synthase